MRRRMSKRQRIDAARETRLWIGQIIVPAAAVVIAVPEARDWCKRKVLGTRDKVKELFNRSK